MKRQGLKVLPAILLTVLLLAGCKQRTPSDYKADPPSDFITAYSDGRGVEKAANLFNMTPEDLSGWMKDRHILWVAADKENLAQISFSEEDTAFSKKCTDFENYSASKLLDLGNLPVSSEFTGQPTVSSRGSASWLTYTRTGNDSGGAYTETQAVTVKNGKLYRLDFQFAEDFDPESLVTDTLDSFSAPMESNKTDYIFWLVAAVCVLLFTLTLLSLAKDLIPRRKKQKGNEKNSLPE